MTGTVLMIRRMGPRVTTAVVVSHCILEVRSGRVFRPVAP